VLTFEGAVSMRPSIGNWALPCQSHYVIDHGTIRWARGFTRDEIQPAASRTTGSWMQSTPPRAAGGGACFGACSVADQVETDVFRSPSI
jgi:hypothetical protein